MAKNIVIVIQFILLIVLGYFYKSSVLFDNTDRAGSITDNLSGTAIRIEQLERELEEGKRTNNRIFKQLRDYEYTLNRERRSNQQLRVELDRAKASSNGISNTITSISAISAGLEEGQRDSDNILQSVQDRGTITIER